MGRVEALELRSVDGGDRLVAEVLAHDRATSSDALLLFGDLPSRGKATLVPSWSDASNLTDPTAPQYSKPT